METWILTLLVFSPLAGILVLMMVPRGADGTVHRAALVSSLVTLGLTILAFAQFYRAVDDASGSRYVLTAHVPWISSETGSSAAGAIDIGYRVGVDGISIWMLGLTSFLMPLAIWGSFSAIKSRVREYYVLLLLLQVGMLGVFCAMDLLLFYVFFEFTLVPLYFLIGIWGGPERRRAANKFFIYTLCGSVLTFAGLVYLAFFAFKATGTTLTLNIEELVRLGREGAIPPGVQWWLFLAFAAGFAVKVPCFPVHTWLPLAHTEAPTAGSVILAGVLLKLGTYGFCRISIPMLPVATWQLAPVIAVLAILGIIYAALAAWVQEDVKKLVAYSSVSHLGFCILGLFSLKLAGVSGAIFYMISHGLSTGALFLVVGCMYERYHTRSIHKIGGLARPMPWFAFFLVFFTLSSIGLPGLNGFIGEFLVLLGTATSATTSDGLPGGPLGYGFAIPAATGIILSAVYMLWMCQRVLFGPLKEPPGTPDTSAGLTTDLTRREIGYLMPIAIACVILGVYPKPLLNDFEGAVTHNILASSSEAKHADRGHRAPEPETDNDTRLVAATMQRRTNQPQAVEPATAEPEPMNVPVADRQSNVLTEIDRIRGDRP
ncbi:MAG: complex I subunit 4 family protein [Planctomycetota bacterium]